MVSWESACAGEEDVGKMYIRTVVSLYFQKA